MARLVFGKRGPDQKRARRFVESADFKQHAPHVRVDQEEIRRLVRRGCAFQRASLPALFRVGRSVLIGDLGNSETLDGDAESRAVHHHEHRG